MGPRHRRKTYKIVDIDALLDEIEENEQKYKNIAATPATRVVTRQLFELHTKKNEDNVDWNEIMKQLKQRNTNYIKNLISSKQIGVNAQHPTNGKTLLMFAVIIGNVDLVKGILNNGANVSIKDEDGLDALDYASKFGQYKITELVFYRTFSGKGNDLKRIATDIHTKKKEAEFMKKQTVNVSYSQIKMSESITEFMINAIKERAPFDPAMLFYAWYFNENSLSSPLWIVMMETYKEILSNTEDKKGWKWLKEQFLNSLICFLPHPNTQIEKKKKSRKLTNFVQLKYAQNEEDKIEWTLQRTLFYELLKRVRTESKKQSDIMLKNQINAIKTQKGRDTWSCNKNIVNRSEAFRKIEMSIIPFLG